MQGREAPLEQGAAGRKCVVTKCFARCTLSELLQTVAGGALQWRTLHALVKMLSTSFTCGSRCVASVVQACGICSILMCISAPQHLCMHLLARFANCCVLSCTVDSLVGVRLAWYDTVTYLTVTFACLAAAHAQPSGTQGSVMGAHIMCRTLHTTCLHVWKVPSNSLTSRTLSASPGHPNTYMADTAAHSQEYRTA